MATHSAATPRATPPRALAAYVLAPLLVGAACGYALRAPSAAACSCIWYSGWTLTLRDVETTATQVDDSRFWPASATLRLTATGARFERTSPDETAGVSSLELTP